MSRTRTILSLSLVTASLGVAGMTAASPGRAATAAKTAPARVQPKAQPATPLLTSNGRPACGNTLAKRTLMQARTELSKDLAALAKLVKTNTDDDKPARRDELMASIRRGLETMEACRDGEPGMITDTGVTDTGTAGIDPWPGDAEADPTVTAM
jgi:hypothetical protein